MQRDGKPGARPASRGGPSGLDRERIYDLIKRDILNGRLEPGIAVSENELAAKYGVSRTPVREALRKLHIERLVTPVPKRGTFVSQLPTAAEARQMYEVREAVAAMTSRLAAARRSNEEVVELKQLLADMASAPDEERAGALATEFIMLIDEMSRNPYLADINRNMVEQLHRLRQGVMQYDRSYFEIALERRRRLVKAIAAQDEDEAETIARDLVRTVRQEALQMLIDG